MTKEGQNDIRGCAEELRLMGCYDSSWNYLTSVFVSAAASHVGHHPSALFAALERYLSYEDMRRISVGVDPELRDGAIRVRQIRYFKDRWPLPEELDYRKSVVEGTCAEMIRKRGQALSKIRELSRQELKSAAVKDFMADSVFQGEMYRSKDWPDTVRKARQLISFGYRLEDAIWQVADSLCNGLLHTEGAFEFGCADALVRWLKSEGSEINHIRNLSTPLDRLGNTIAVLQENNAPSESITSLRNIIDTVKELGGATVNELCAACGDDLGAVLGVLYPWAIKKNVI